MVNKFISKIHKYYTVNNYGLYIKIILQAKFRYDILKKEGENMYRNRGELPHLKLNLNNESNDSNNSNDKLARFFESDGGYPVPGFWNYWNGYYYVIHYDKNFLIIEIIISMFVLLLAGLIYLYGYNVNFNDPISSIKDNMLKIQLIQMPITLGLAGALMFICKNRKKLIKSLRIVAVISMVASIIFTGIKIYMDNKYNDEKFGEFYEQYEKNNSTYSDTASVSVTIKGVSILNSKEDYVSKCKGSYMRFSIKQAIYLIFNILIALVIFYLIYRISYIESKRERLQKDDIVLFDEEENVKF